MLQLFFQFSNKFQRVGVGSISIGVFSDDSVNFGMPTLLASTLTQTPNSHKPHNIQSMNRRIYLPVFRVPAAYSLHTPVKVGGGYRIMTYLHLKQKQYLSPRYYVQSNTPPLQFVLAEIPSRQLFGVVSIFVH